MAEGKEDIAVQVAEHDLVYAVFFKEAGEERGLEFEPHGRVVNESDEDISLLPDFFYVVEAELKAFGFAQVEFFVVFGVIGTAGARPAARTADDDVFKFDAVVLEKIKSIVGRGAPELGYTVPPIVVIAADEHLFAGEIAQTFKVEESLLQRGAPAYVAADKNYVVGRNFGKPVGPYLIEMPLPVGAENIHGLIRKPRKMQIAYGKNLHATIISQ